MEEGGLTFNLYFGQSLWWLYVIDCGGCSFGLPDPGQGQCGNHQKCVVSVLGKAIGHLVGEVSWEILLRCLGPRA